LAARPISSGCFPRPTSIISRVSTGASLEEIWKYWLSHVAASVENVSGILTVRLDAFKAVDANETVRDIVRLSEALVNKITLRNRADALARAETEVKSARERLARAREETLKFRNHNLIIDPASRATGIGELIGKLSIERIDLLSSLSTFSDSLSTDAPSQRLQRTRLAIVDRLIADLRKKLTDGQGSGAVSEQIASYENLKLDEQFAERLYSIALAAYESARQDLERQQLYLVTIVPPTFPEAATYPKVLANSSLLFGALLIAWAIIVLILASIADQTT
jgi:capsular polysaccharide transport system permease protein